MLRLVYRERLPEAHIVTRNADGGVVRFAAEADEDGFLSAGAFAGRDDMQISVQGCEDRVLLVSRFDNLGKGASGAAIQDMNLVLGLEETAGLIVEE